MESWHCRDDITTSNDLDFLVLSGKLMSNGHPDGIVALAPLPYLRPSLQLSKEVFSSHSFI
jgi:hypothetical protein